MRADPVPRESPAPRRRTSVRWRRPARCPRAESRRRASANSCDGHRPPGSAAWLPPRPGKNVNDSSSAVPARRPPNEDTPRERALSRRGFVPVFRPQVWPRQVSAVHRRRAAEAAPRPTGHLAQWPTGCGLHRTHLNSNEIARTRKMKVASGRSVKACWFIWR